MLNYPRWKLIRFNYFYLVYRTWDGTVDWVGPQLNWYPVGWNK